MAGMSKMTSQVTEAGKQFSNLRFQLRAHRCLLSSGNSFTPQSIINLPVCTEVFTAEEENRKDERQHQLEEGTEAPIYLVLETA